MDGHDWKLEIYHHSKFKERIRGGHFSTSPLLDDGQFYWECQKCKARLVGYQVRGERPAKNRKVWVPNTKPDDHYGEKRLACDEMILYLVMES